jgi:hypothetical protein
MHKSKVRKLGNACILGSNVFSGYYGLDRDTFHDNLFIECWLNLVPMKEFVLTVKRLKFIPICAISVSTSQRSIEGH